MHYTTIAVPSSERARIISGRLYTNPDVDRSDSVAVISHPYGPLGGTQSDPVVMTTAYAFQSIDVPVLTFDFRSPTTFRGVVERGDYLAVVKYALRQVPRAGTIYCCGYSYGGLCLPTTKDIRQGAEIELKVHYIVISPLLSPVSLFLTLSNNDRYRHVREESHLAIWGEHDNFTSSARLKKVWTDGVMIKSADHFWRDKDSMTHLQASILEFISKSATNTINASP